MFRERNMCIPSSSTPSQSTLIEAQGQSTSSNFQLPMSGKEKEKSSFYIAWNIENGYLICSSFI